MSEPKPSPDHGPTVGLSSIPSLTGTGGDTQGLSPAASSATPPLIGPYVLLGELGRGGMGVVYRAEDPRLKREVALKVMLPQFAANPVAKARFVREARAQAKVEHDHVAAIHQVDEHDGLPYIVMPLLKGMTLHAALKANPRPPLQEVIRIGREMAEGLAAAHEKGLVHRDIKPANVWLEGKKLRVKVLDFGLARIASDAATEDTDGPVTQQGAVVGTPAYMSPEQGRGLAVDGRTDLWSLGVVLYQMTTGGLPFRGATQLAILTSLALDHPPPPVDVNPAVPPHLSDFVMRLLAKDPGHRPPTAEAAAEELKAIEAGFVNAVRVIPLDAPPPLVVAPVGPDPFADLDATEANSAPEAEVGEEGDAPVTPVKPRGGFPMWAIVGALLLAVAAVGVVVSLMGKKPNPDVTQADPPAVTPPKVIPPVVNPPFDPPLPADPTFFNGKDLTGWEGDPKVWTVVNGEIVAKQPGNLAGGQRLSYSRLLGDFELSFEAQAPTAADKRVTSTLDFRALDAQNCGVLNLSGLSTLWYRSGTAGTRLAALPPDAPLGEKLFVPDGYNRYVVRVVGRKVTVSLNGTRVNEVEFPNLADRGRITWTLNAEFDGLRIRNLRLVELPPPDPTFFNGKDLSGWEGATMHWKAENGALVGTGPPEAQGAPFITTKKDYTDFELSYRIAMSDSAEVTTRLVFRSSWVGPPSYYAFGPQFNLRKHSKDTFLTPRQDGGDGFAAKGSGVRPDAFNEVKVRCVGKQVTVTVNGESHFDGEMTMPPKGRIGFTTGPKGRVDIRDIRFTDLSKPSDPDRAAAESLRPHAKMVRLRMKAGGRVANIPIAEPLPAEPFWLMGIGFDGQEVPEGFAADVLVPTVIGLERFGEIYDIDARLVRPGRERDLAALRRLPAVYALYVNRTRSDSPEGKAIAAAFPRWRVVFSDRTVEPRVAGEWAPLFNGKDTAGWFVTGGDKISVVTEAGRQALRIKPGGSLVTKETYRDFHLSVEFLTLKPGASAGVGYRTGPASMLFSSDLEAPGKLLAWGKCSVRSAEVKNGRVVPRVGTVAANHVGHFPTPLKPPGEWNTLEIVAIGDTAFHGLNGKWVCVGADMRENDVPVVEGTIRLYALGGDGVVFGNVRIREVTALPEQFGGPKTVGAEDRERKAAEVLHRFCDLGVAGVGKPTAYISPNDPLPTEPFSVRTIGVNGDTPADSRAAFFQAVPDLPGVTRIADWFNRLKWTDADFALLAGFPLKDTLTEIVLPSVELTPGALDGIQKFLALRHIAFEAQSADDALLDRVATEHPTLARLALKRLGFRATPTAKAAAALGKLKLEQLTFLECKRIDAAWCKEVAKIVELRTLSFDGTPVDDAMLVEIAKCPGVRKLTLFASGVTPAGLEALRECKTLTELHVKGNDALNEAGAKRLAGLMPQCKIVWDGGVIEAVSKP